MYGDVRCHASELFDRAMLLFMNNEKFSLGRGLNRCLKPTSVPVVEERLFGNAVWVVGALRSLKDMLPRGATSILLAFFFMANAIAQTHRANTEVLSLPREQRAAQPRYGMCFPPG